MLELTGTICFVLWSYIAILRLRPPRIATFITDATTGVEYFVTTWGDIHVRLDHRNDGEKTGEIIDHDPNPATWPPTFNA